MKQKIHILSVTGSDSTGGAGIQSDIRTISALGGIAVSAVTAVTIQTSTGIQAMHPLPTDLIIGQVKATVAEVHPKAVKVGLVNDGDTIRQLRDEIIGCRHIVCDPGILSSRNEPLADDASIRCLCQYLIPEAELLILKCSEAERILTVSIDTDADMISAAKAFLHMGAQWVLLRGRQSDDRLTALLYGQPDGKVVSRFFSSLNIEGWQKHGVGGALSTAIATRLGFGDDLETALSHAHDYLHSQVVYATDEEARNLRSADLYDQLMTLIAGHYSQQHDVKFYADRLAITPRYLSQITDKVVGQSPKQIISNYLMQQAKVLLSTTRLTIQEISIHLGFTTQSSFCQFFQKQEGCSPNQYRS